MDINVNVGIKTDNYIEMEIIQQWYILMEIKLGIKMENL